MVQVESTLSANCVGAFGLIFDGTEQVNSGRHGGAWADAHGSSGILSCANIGMFFEMSV